MKISEKLNNCVFGKPAKSPNGGENHIELVTYMAKLFENQGFTSCFEMPIYLKNESKKYAIDLMVEKGDKIIFIECGECDSEKIDALKRYFDTIHISYDEFKIMKQFDEINSKLNFDKVIYSKKIPNSFYLNCYHFGGGSGYLTRVSPLFMEIVNKIRMDCLKVCNRDNFPSQIRVIEAIARRIKDDFLEQHIDNEKIVFDFSKNRNRHTGGNKQ